MARHRLLTKRAWRHAALIAVAVGGVALPQSGRGQTLDEINAEKDRITALAALVEAQAALKAAEKQLANATKDADSAEAQAKIGTVTGLSNGPDGTIAVKEDAGKAEATLMSAKATTDAAREIAKAVVAKVPGKCVVLIAGGEIPQFTHYLQFQLRRNTITALFTSAAALSEQSEKEGDQLMVDAGADPADIRPQPTGVGLLNVPIATSAGAILDALTKLGSYFQTDYEIGGIGLETDAEQLISSVGGALAKENATVLIPSRGVQSIHEAEELFGELLALSVLHRDKLTQLQTKSAVARAKAAAESAPDKKKLFEEAIAAYDRGAAPLSVALTKLDELIASLTVTDSAGAMLGAQVMEEKVTYDALTTANTFALMVDTRAAVGAYYTKKNVWTFLGAMPFYTMGGTVATYWLVEPKTAKVMASGQVALHSGYRKVNEVEKLFLVTDPSPKVSSSDPPSTPPKPTCPAVAQ